MVRQAKKAGCQVGFSTNGKRLTPEVSKELIELGLDWISFSVDAATPELYGRIRQGADFETILGNMAVLRDLKLSNRRENPQMMMVFVALGGEPEIQNYHELPAYIDLAKELGVEHVVIKNLDVILKDEDDQRRLFRHDQAPADEIEGFFDQAQARAFATGVKLRRYHLHPKEQAVCEHNPLDSLFINWEGWVSPCITHSYAEDRVFAGERIKAVCQRFGSVHEASLEGIWNRPAYRDFRQRFALRRQAENRELFDVLLNASSGSPVSLPPAPDGCDSCYYLYGI
jgi:MoaA/NifB/PqqE/SkfB family radical SAM enzyme